MRSKSILRRGFSSVGGVEHALIFKALFPGCQHIVGERMSLRGAVSYVPNIGQGLTLPQPLGGSSAEYEASSRIGVKRSMRS